MNKYKSDGWYADETIALIAIIKELNVQRKSRVSELEWQEIARRLEEKGHQRRPGEIIERYSRLKSSYFSAKSRNKTCEYYNYLNDLLLHQLPPVQEGLTDLDEPEAELEADPMEIQDEEMEEKYADTLHIDSNNTSYNSEGTSSRCKWTDVEIEAFLVYQLIAKEMTRKSFAKRPDQLRFKFHQLTKEFFKSNNTDKTFKYFYTMHDILESRNVSNGGGTSGEENDSANSEDEEVARASEGSNESEQALWIRCKWTDEETEAFINIIINKNYQARLMRSRKAKVFKLLSKEMAKLQYDKSPDKLHIKYNQLKRMYNKSQLSGQLFCHYELVHKMLNSAQTPASSSSESESNDSDNEEETGDKSRRSSGRSDGYHYWTDLEVDEFLATIKEHELFQVLDGSKKRNFRTLINISKLLAKKSLNRTPHQLKNKLRLLLTRYKEAKKEGVNNVRILPRHFKLMDELMQSKRSVKPHKKTVREVTKAESIKEKSPTPPKVESESETSSSTCDLLQAGAAIKTFEDDFEMPPEPTPLEVLTSISEGQKELLAYLKTSNENFLKQQLEMQKHFLQEMSAMMRQEREENFRMLRQLLQGNNNKQ
ncbi:uncharacterized protein LOC115632513 isoform X2 [Scaptodrosophila lebanonensis]|uniref:Uncharacterized protein LOC115632513 isoform X2 n=1 Tax=Drosophila lebanonensis TaxID=7225 RepID=A0A6J2UAM9_DROLE|nr:uncharacterized protein LOC115632513 isoform X2 [Scaptodrosophila lebanonensis]